MLLHALAVGALYAAGFYLLIERGWRGMVLGLALLSHGTNLLVFTAPGLVRGAVPLVPEGLATPPGPVPDPLVQAMILTAVVIGFGMIALTLAMVRQALRGEERENPEGRSEATVPGEEGS